MTWRISRESIGVFGAMHVLSQLAHSYVAQWDRAALGGAQHPALKRNFPPPTGQIFLAIRERGRGASR
jgi:hypothetical protein